jgi:hypothetical protein
MQYRIVLVKNKLMKKIFFKGSSYENAIKSFIELRKDNKVDLPQRHMNYKGIIPIEYEILLLKTRTEFDKNRIIRDELGRFVEEENNSTKWVILESASYQVEETFYVYGYDNIHDRFTVRDIIKKILMKGIRVKNTTKEIIVVKNKLIIRGEDFDFIICKCPDDCLRLHNKLKEVSSKSRMKNLLFLGMASDKTAGDIYDIIKEKTGWNMTKIWRTTTRP